MSKKNEEQQQETQGMDFLQSLPRRWVTTYIPLAILYSSCCSRSIGW